MKSKSVNLNGYALDTRRVYRDQHESNAPDSIITGIQEGNGPLPGDEIPW